jgi:hypothetical protein
MDRLELEKLIHISSSPYGAAQGSHALVVCTEWDEFQVRTTTSFLYIYIYIYMCVCVCV